MERWWFVLALVFLSPVQAAPSRAEMLAAPCFACHGVDGVGAGDIPRLDVEAQRIEVKMIDFKDPDARGTIMPRIARGYTAEEIELIADYLGTR